MITIHAKPKARFFRIRGQGSGGLWVRAGISLLENRFGLVELRILCAVLHQNRPNHPLRMLSGRIEKRYELCSAEWPQTQIA
jgi:hypothetical protein